MVPRRVDSAPFVQAPLALKLFPCMRPLVERPPPLTRLLPPHHHLRCCLYCGCPLQRARHSLPGSSALSASCSSQQEKWKNMPACVGRPMSREPGSLVGWALASLTKTGSCISRQLRRTQEAKPPALAPSTHSLWAQAALHSQLSRLLSLWYPVLETAQSFSPSEFRGTGALSRALGHHPENLPHEEQYKSPGPLS